jgi:hypothetical protein
LVGKVGFSPSPLHQQISDSGIKVLAYQRDEDRLNKTFEVMYSLEQQNLLIDGFKNPQK